jgi:NAD(P)-dependent dehydrogenase (short-subunit alcohol dehydrogenase family)
MFESVVGFWMRFKNKVIWVTGAGSGFGRALAKAFVAEGGVVVVSGRRGVRLEELKRSLGDACVVRAFDVSVSLEVQEAVEEVMREQGRIDVLVNNAGIFPVKRELMETEIVDFDRTLATNLRGPFLMMRGVIPWMKEAGSGRIINVSAPLKHFPTASAYCASKCALDSLTKASALELRGVDILINAVEPPMMDTEMHVGGKQPEECVGPVLDLAAAPAGSPTGRILKIE